MLAASLVIVISAVTLYYLHLTVLRKQFEEEMRRNKIQAAARKKKVDILYGRKPKVDE